MRGNAKAYLNVAISVAINFREFLRFVQYPKIKYSQRKVASRQTINNLQKKLAIPQPIFHSNAIGRGFVCRLYKLPKMANGAFTMSCLSKELVKQFVQLARRNYLHWQKKCVNTTSHSRDLRCDLHVLMAYLWCSIWRYFQYFNISIFN